MSDLDIPEFLKRDASWPERGDALSTLQLDNAQPRPRKTGAVKKRFPKEKFEARKALAEGARWDARNNKWMHDPKPVYAHAESVKIDGKNWFEWAR